MTDTDIVTRLAREADPDRHYPDAALFADDVAFLGRFAALVAEECAKAADAETARILSKQDPKARPGSDADDVNRNLRMFAVMIPEVADTIRAKFKEPT